MEKIQIDLEILKELETDLLLSLSYNIEDRFSTIIDSLSYKNFLGDSIEYMTDNGIPITNDLQIQYANILCNNFKQDITALVYYDEESNMIKINENLMAFEYGDYYHPALKLVTGAMELILKDNM
jgi:hypothetical protein